MKYSNVFYLKSLPTCLSYLRRQRATWICIAGLAITAALGISTKPAQASFGAEIPFLIQIIVQAIEQVKNLQTIIGTSRETITILQDMNRGVKEVLRVANTAHVPLPPQVYQMANTIDQATQEAERLYGPLPVNAPQHTRLSYQSGAEALFLSQDAFEYSTFLDSTGERIKSSAVMASQASAASLTAESMGVLIHAVSHSNRIGAKNLEITATQRLEQSARENARFENFISTQNQIERGLTTTILPDLNSFSTDSESQAFIPDSVSSNRGGPL